MWGDSGAILLTPPPTDPHLILGAEEGIFTLNQSEREATLELVGPGGVGGSGGHGGQTWGGGLTFCPDTPTPLLQLYHSRTSWLYVIGNVLMSVSGEFWGAGGGCRVGVPLTADPPPPAP